MTDVRIVAFLIKHNWRHSGRPQRRRRFLRRGGPPAACRRAGRVYPEATISRSFELKEFKSGAVRMALEAQVPIIPSSSGAPTGVDQGPSNSWAATRYRSPSGWAPCCPGRHASRTRFVIAGRDDHHAARVQSSIPIRRCPLGAAPPRRWEPTPAEAPIGRPNSRARPPGGRATLMLPALIATDVDGTLLDADEAGHPRTRQAVRARRQRVPSSCWRPAGPALDRPGGRRARVRADGGVRNGG